MTSKQRGVFAACVVTTLISSFMGSALNLSITNISEDFQCGATTVTWVINAFTLVTATCSVPFGHLGDITDRRRIFLCGIGIFSFASLLCMLAPGIYWLIGVRALQGIGSAMILGVNIPVMLSAFPPEHRGRMLGYSVTAVYVGLSIGPVLGGLLNATLGWRSIFALAFILPAISFLLAWHYVSGQEVVGKPDINPVGNLLFMVSIASLLLGLSLWSAAWAKVLVGASIVCFVFFIRNELRVAAPSVQVRLFASDAGYTLSNVAALLNYGATFAIGYTMSIYLQNVAGLSTSLAGIVLISQPVMQAVVSPFAGRLSERIAPYKLASLGMGIITVGLFFLAGVDATTSLPRVIANLAMVGVGFGLFSSPNNNAVISCVDRSHVGEANAILSTMRTLGMSISMVVVLHIIDLHLGDVVITEAAPASIVAAIHTVMMLSACVCLVGTAISLVRGKAGRR